MAHQWPDEMPPKPPALPAAVGLPGGPDGGSGPPPPPPGAVELGLSACRAVPGRPHAASAGEAGRSEPRVGAFRPRGSANGGGAAGPGTMRSADGQPPDVLVIEGGPDEGGAGVPVTEGGVGGLPVDPVAGVPDDWTVSVTGVTAPLTPATVGGGTVAGSASSAGAVSWTVAAGAVRRAGLEAAAVVVGDLAVVVGVGSAVVATVVRAVRTTVGAGAVELGG
jgi:hypothetical protein